MLVKGLLVYTKINGLWKHTAASAHHRLPLIHAGKPTGDIKCTWRFMEAVVIYTADYVTNILSTWNGDSVLCLLCQSDLFWNITGCRIWSWAPMPCEKTWPEGLSRQKPSPKGHVFHTAWETMIKSYYSTLTDWFFFILFTETWILML